MYTYNFYENENKNPRTMDIINIKNNIMQYAHAGIINVNSILSLNYLIKDIVTLRTVVFTGGCTNYLKMHQ